MFITVYDTPELKHLNRYKKQISSDWYDLGIQLLDKDCYDELKTVQKNNPHDNGGCCTEMLSLWLKKTKNPSWESFLKALKIIEKKDLVSLIESRLTKGMCIIYQCI